MNRLIDSMPHLKGERIELRPLTAADADGLRELTDCEEVYRYLPTFLLEKQVADPAEAIRRMNDESREDSLFLGVFSREGFCGLAELYGFSAPLRKASVGNRFLPRCWGQGISSETLGLLIAWLFNDTRVRVLTASAMPENTASAAVLKKNGFRCVAHAVPEDWGFGQPTIADKWVRTAAGFRRECRSPGAED